MVWRSW